MKLIRFGAIGQEVPGVMLADGTRLDARGFGEDYDENFFGTEGVQRLLAWLKTEGENAPNVPADIRWGAPVCRPSKIICIGLNFSDHTAESSMEQPTEPVVFFKASSALCGPNDDLILPRNSSKVDWEVELAVVVGKRASYVEEADALEHVAGYCLHNDYSERAFQLERGGQWVKGKSCDTFAPLGPYLVTPDELEDIDSLSMWLEVNGERKQSGNTSNLIFDIPILISYLSQFMTLLPGDVISTGTPAGVGLGFVPPQYLAAGDVVELGIDALGKSKQLVTEYRKTD